MLKKIFLLIFICFLFSFYPLCSFSNNLSNEESYDIEKNIKELMIVSSNLTINLNAGNIDGVNNFADSSDSSTNWVNLQSSLANGTLNSFSLPSALNSGWDGANTANSPSVLKFDGLNDFVSLDNTGLLNNNFTFEVWVKVNALPASSGSFGLISIGDGTNEHTLGIANNFSSQNGFYISSSFSSGVNAISQNFLPAISTWYHVAGVRNTSDNSLMLYVNGNEAGSVSLNNSVASFGVAPVVRIGSRSNNSGFLNGSISNVRIYSTAINSSQVLQNYLSEAYKFQGVDSISPGFIFNDFIGSSFKKTGDTFSVLVEDVNPSVNGDNDISAISSLSCSIGTQSLTNQTPQEQNFSSGLSFDGIDDYVILNPIQDFPAKEITASFWVMTTYSGQGLLSYASTASDNDFLVFRAGNISVNIMGNAVSTGVSVNDGRWHFVAVSWRSSNGELKLFKDGILSYSNNLFTGSSITPGGAFVIGQDQNSVGGDFDSSQAFNGQITNVQIYKRVLNQEEIAANYKSPYEIANPFGLIASWKFDDNSTNSSSVLNALGKKWNSSSNLLIQDSGLTSMLTNFNFNRSSGWVNQYSFNLAKYVFAIPVLAGSNQVNKISCIATDFSGNSNTLELGGVFIISSGPQITTTLANNASLMAGDSFSVTVSDNTPDSSSLLNPTNINAALDGNAFSQTCSINPITYSKALNFDGLDDYLDLGNGSKVRDILVKTITLWTKLDTQTPLAQANSYFINKGDVWYLATDPTNNRNIFVHNFSGANGKWAFPQFSTNIWHNIVIVYDKQSSLNDPEIYVDGVQQAITEINTPSGVALSDSAFNLKLSKSESVSGYIDGSIDDLQIYNRPLALEEITRLVLSPGRIINAKGLAGWWRFDKLEDLDGNNLVDNVKDYSGNLNNGTLIFGTSLSSSILDSDLPGSIDGRSGTCSISITNTSLSGTSDFINKPLVVSTSNASSLSGSETKNITFIRNKNPLLPTITSALVNGNNVVAPYVLNDGQTLTLTFSSSDPNASDLITLSTPTAPQVGTFTPSVGSNPSSATFTFTPNSSHIGMNYTFTVRATDNFSLASASDLSISFLVNSSVSVTPTPTISPQPTSTPTATPLSSSSSSTSSGVLATPTPSPSPSSTPKIEPTPTQSNIDINSLPVVIATFPELPDFVTESTGLAVDSKSDKNIVIAGSPASFSVDPKISVSNDLLNLLSSGSTFQVKIVDSKNQEFTIDASSLINPENINDIQLQLSKIPSSAVQGEGYLILFNNGKPIAKINIFILRSQSLTDADIELYKPDIQTIVVIRRPKFVKFVIAGKNFFRKKIIVGNKEVLTSKFQTSVSILPNSNLKLVKTRVLKGKKVIVARYQILNNKLDSKTTVRIVNPYGQTFKVVDIPVKNATGSHIERTK